MKFKSYIFKGLVAAACVGGFASCQDMLESDSTYVIYDNENHLISPADTANSLIGIIYRMQAIGDRTHLLGEVRGDLVSVRTSANADLRDLASFNVGDDNKYNNPRDYYAIINNCNYFIAYADTSMRDNRNNQIFLKEYAQIKTIRAWVYLQLALNYGKVPFYTNPILKESDGYIENYPKYNLQQICDYFINEDGLKDLINVSFPSLKTVGSVYMMNCYFPTDVVLGDLYLWRASLTGNKNDYREAAKSYFRWINDTRIYGDGTQKPIYRINSNTYNATWYENSFENNHPMPSNSYSGLFSSSYASSSGNELVTMIPMDSAAAQGYYSEVQGLYNSTFNSTSGTSSLEYYIEPSKSLINLSREQSYYLLDSNGDEVDVPILTDEDEKYNGDLRLTAVWNTFTTGGTGIEDVSELQSVSKTAQRNIWVYRKTDVYLRLAEALNNGGFPRMAYAILATGLSKQIVRDSVQAYCTKADSLYIEQLAPNNEFANFVARNGVASVSGMNSMGIHSRGCGYSELNPNYVYPVDSTGFEAGGDTLEWVYNVMPVEQQKVDSMILEEMALETAFEGKRYYDLMRYAYRYNNNAILADPISTRNGAESKDNALWSLLMDRNNWFLSWKGKIGMK